MANRNMANGGKIWMNHALPKMVDLSITIGASGAVSSFSGNLVASVVKQAAAGTYQITMQDPYYSIIGVLLMAPQVASGTSGINQLEIIGSVSQGSGPGNGAVLTVQAVNPSGTVANPNSGAVLRMVMFFNDSSAI